MEAESVEMSKVAVMKTLAGKDLLGLSVTSSCSSSYVQEEEEEEEEKSKKVACFSSYEQDKERLKEMGDLKRKREEGSSNSISPQEQVSTFRMWERSLKVARGMENKKCPGPLIPCSTSSLSDQETVKLIEKLMQKHGCISPVVGEGSFTRSKGISVPIFTDNSGLRVTHSSSSPQEEEGRERQLYYKEAKSEIPTLISTPFLADEG